MDQNVNIKDLAINGVLFAKYHSEGDTLFLKIITPIVHGNAGQSEDLCAHIIGCLENKQYGRLSYLNIK